MGWFAVLVAGIGAYLLFHTDHLVMGAIETIAAIGCFWSWGVMHNYAFDKAKRRPDHTGRFYGQTPAEAEGVPDWIASINLVSSLVGLILFIAGIVFMVRR
ncbi:MAG TPA: hypothetical protein PKJ41_17655 [Bryobacteraceae bacterium]|nr:hypothetical protein [Bryobacteraceae bacterium]HPT25104.1 hypothetical protein [Bryobacteraceae bacterium]